MTKRFAVSDHPLILESKYEKANVDGPPPAAPPATGIHGGIDIRDAHNGQLRLRVYLPEPFAMLNADVDGLHGGFLTTDENGQRLFALTTSGLTILQLADVEVSREQHQRTAFPTYQRSNAAGDNGIGETRVALLRGKLGGQLQVRTVL